MADSKITALASIGTGTDPANDPLVIVDVSDVSPGGMSATGTTKRVTLNNLLACSPTATLASATISGDLTVDTSTLKVDSANNRVGIVQATPLYPLHLVGEFGLEEASPAGTGSKLRFIGDATKYNFRLGKQLTANNTFEITPSTAVGGGTFSNPVYTVSYDGIHTFLDGAGGTRMTLNSTGLGVGGSPSGKIHAQGTGVLGLFTQGAAPAAALSAVTIQAPVASGFSSLPVLNFWYQNTGISNPASECFAIRTSSTDRLYIDAAGNCGIGVTPSAGKGCLQLSSGINFPATQVASTDPNTLDDYEEGTFTPTVIGSSTAGTATYATQIGRYVKIGRQVTAWIHLEWSAGTGTGNLRFGGLPFTIITLAINNYPSAAIGYINGIALSANNIAIAYGQNAEAAVNLGQYPIGGGSGSSVAYDAAGQIIFTITYEV